MSFDAKYLNESSSKLNPSYKALIYLMAQQTDKFEDRKQAYLPVTPPCICLSPDRIGGHMCC